MKSFRILTCALLAASLLSCKKDPLESFPPELTIVKNNIGDAFEALDHQLFASSTRLAYLVDDTSRARGEMHSLGSRKPDFVGDFGLVSSTGILRMIEPYNSMEGADISGQAHVQVMFGTKSPALSNTFMSVEGFPSVVEGYPIMKLNELKGALTALFFPHEMLDPIIRPIVEGQKFEIWMMEKGGTLIWDQDLPDIGRNLFTDPYYDPFPNLKIALQKIVAEDFGETTYSFFRANTTEEVVKRAHWVTFSHFGQEWKIVYVIIE